MISKVPRLSKYTKLILLLVSLICIYIYMSNAEAQPLVYQSESPNGESPREIKFTYNSDLDRDELVKRKYLELESLMNQKIGLPNKAKLVMPPKDIENYQRANATLMIMARNSDYRAVISTMKQIEKRFNNKFHYPYVFLNDGEFSKKFKSTMVEIASGEVFFEKIKEEDWVQPADIDIPKQQQGMRKLTKEGIAYANKISYHNMCRYYSIQFYNHPRMQQFKYYWRFEPNTDYFCDIDYDVFKFMEHNDKVYGFVIALYDAEQTVETLWPLTMDFAKRHPHWINNNGAFNWLTENLMNPQKTEFTGGYSTCHFWSNFEIANMDFYRGEAYSSWAKELDESGGFYYERWGDAPVHSVGVGLFADKRQVHWFRDIGYKHHPYTNCPNSDKCGGCQTGKFTYEHLMDQNCISNWVDYELDQSENYF
ncbi:putative mannosyltransferase [Martiniozyma asiatica (nom. inval.)]|nr:putative mannosyltransferase [Martiniozyma asiatica]